MTTSMTGSRRRLALRWLAAIIGFPIGGFVGHLVAGPAATAPAALISGLIAGAVIGTGQAIALGLPSRPMALWAGVTALGLGVGLAGVTALIGQIDTMTDAVALGAFSGLTLGAGQAVALARLRVPNAWVWVLTTALAWSLGWLTTSAIGVALAAGWPVYGLSGAIVSTIISAAALWRLAGRESVAPATT